jgi:hypothetical protein
MTQASIPITFQSRLAQPWLSSAAWDGLLIISPALITSAIAIALRNQINGNEYLPVWAWVAFVLLVDVAHVYASGFRTYLNPKALATHKALLVGIPIACWAIGCFLYTLDALWFWRVLAYLAVFHFIRQQYGFMALYSRKDPQPFWKFKHLDAACIYAATLYPILYWHTHMPRNFIWFIEGDFIQSMPAFLGTLGLIAYCTIVTLYLAKELYLFRLTGFINLPKNLIVIGTAISWFVGIVALNSDVAFTMTNVLSHGIPYMALVWLYQRQRPQPALRFNAVGETTGSFAVTSQSLGKNFDPGGTPRKFVESDGKRSSVPVESGEESGSQLMKKLETASKMLVTFVPAFVAILWLFAYLEEGLWDGFVWREHIGLFAPFWQLPSITDPAVLAILIPLLALPQSTHYVLDGFIWRVKDRSSVWSA